MWQGRWCSWEVHVEQVIYSNYTVILPYTYLGRVVKVRGWWEKRGEKQSDVLHGIYHVFIHNWCVHRPCCVIVWLCLAHISLSMIRLLKSTLQPSVATDKHHWIIGSL